VPRTTPRLEQAIRAERAEALGLTRVLPDDGKRPVARMIEALRALDTQTPPSSAVIPGLLDGLENVERLVARWLPSEVQPGAKTSRAPSKPLKA
jgi:predicted glycosyltransferase